MPNRITAAKAQYQNSLILDFGFADEDKEWKKVYRIH
jgi:hypothetical protein